MSRVYEPQKPNSFSVGLAHVVHVTMEHDDDNTKRLVFECWCNHNGYYYHDFGFEKMEKWKED